MAVPVVSLHGVLLQVVATEVAGDGTRNGTAEVIVTLSNLNDNNPVFQQSLYTVTIPEDEGVGMSVITVGNLYYNIITSILRIAKYLHINIPPF